MNFKTLSFDTMYQASFNKDPQFEGVFWMGVKTTGIFCRPTCRARKPKKENVEFFSTPQAAMQKGFRPCKTCRPLENPDQTPPAISKLLQDLQAEPSLKIKEQDLRDRGLDPSTVRRWFLKHHGMTFHSFSRMFKLNTAFKKLTSGEGVLDTALESGFESVSGFSESFKSVFGVSPKNASQEKVLNLKRIETPLGTMMAVASDKGICLLEYSDRKSLPTELKLIAKHYDSTIIVGEHAYFDLLEKELKAYFLGELKEFSVPLDYIGTDFQKTVWNQLLTIPYGSTRSYQQQAQMIDKPSAVRAVANANGLNKISILVPCHRVIGSDGKLTGYGGGIWRKQKLLELEQAILF